MARMRRSAWLVVAVVSSSVVGCDLEERRQCEELSRDAQSFVTDAGGLITEVSGAGLLAAAMNPGLEAKTKALDARNDSIAARWEKAPQSCKEQVVRDLRPVLEKLPLPQDWTPDRTVEARNTRREEEAQKAREEAERAEREAKIAADRDLMEKALAVKLIEIRRERHGYYSSITDFIIPVEFSNRSAETVIGTSGRMSCYDNLENLEGYFTTSQNDLNLRPGDFRVVNLATDDIRSRWLENAECTKQVWEPEAVRFEKTGLVRVELEY